MQILGESAVLDATLKRQELELNNKAHEDVVAPKLEFLLQVLLEIAFRLYTCSAETRLIVMTTERIAKSYGYQEVQVGVSPEFIFVCIEHQGKLYSHTRKTGPIGINMSRLAELTGICLAVERHELTLEETYKRVQGVKNFSYGSLTLTLAIAASTFAFGFLNGGDLRVCVCGFVAGGLNMAIRLMLSRIHLFPMFVFGCCGFCGPLIAGILAYAFGFSKAEGGLSMMISVLLLVPGFPFVNGVLDLFKGYYSMGILRLVNTKILLLAVSVGFTLALNFLMHFVAK